MTCDVDTATVDVVLPAQRDRGQHLVLAAGQAREHRARRRRRPRLAEDHVVQHDLGVGAEHRARRQAALQHPLPADRRLGARDALDVVQRRLAVERFLDDVALASRRFAQAQLVEFDAELAQQLAARRGLRDAR